MISRKELGYVSSWASKIPYPGEEYAYDAISNLKQAVEDYKSFYLNKEYDIILSDGEQLLFEILSKNLCHMLGVNYKNLTSEYFDEFRHTILGVSGSIQSFNLLEKLIEKMDDVLEYDYKRGGIIFNYYRIMIKCSIFDKLSYFSKFNFGVINFDKGIYSEMSETAFNGNSEKLLYVQSNEATCPYFMMGILPDNRIDTSDVKYAVETLIAPSNVKDFFNNQEVAIPTQIIITTEDKMEKKIATSSEKIALLNQYRSIINEYRLPHMLNIYGDYEVMLNSDSNVKKRVK